MKNTTDITKIEKFSGESDLKSFLAANYIKQVTNYFGDEKLALRFFSSVIASTQRIPELIKCTPTSIINSFMTMAQLGFMPSGVSGEAYVLPYKKGQVLEAQFQIGYQGLVTLFYRSGVKEIAAEIVYSNDFFEYVNGQITHRPDIFSKDRGTPVGAYVIVGLQTGGSVNKVMSSHEILGIGSKFSKSYSSEYSPWKIKNDPQLWMWKKTVLKQVAKLVPKNEAIMTAIAEDNKDSIIADRLESAKAESETLKMGNLLKDENKNTKKADKEGQSEDGPTDAEGDQSAPDGEETIRR